MQINLSFDPKLSAEELRGFARTVAEIEWLLLILVLLYQTVVLPATEAATALAMAMFFFAAFVLSFRYVNFYRKESYWKITVETMVMIVFITWVLVYTGRLESPLLNLYLLVIITSALALGKLATLLEIIMIAVCYVWLGYPERNQSQPFMSYMTMLSAQLAPIVLVGYIATMLSADVRRALIQLRFLSETDELTGIFNVRAFTAISERIFKQAARYGRPFSILLVDSDSLKTVNDTYGHEAGNQLIKSAVQCIQNQLRETDILARYGGDEFVVLLPETPCSSAAGVAARIRQNIEDTPLSVRNKKIRMTVSIGIASYPEHGDNLKAILEKTDQAMYESKTLGRNRVTMYNDKQIKQEA
ncbi:MAG: GGDEF domain-containing protein [Pseudomonadota bacterium]